MAPLLAFVDIFVESAHMDEVVQALAKLDNIEELYEVTGEFDIVTLVPSRRHRRVQGCVEEQDHEDQGCQEHRQLHCTETHKGARLSGEFLSPAPHASVAVSHKD